MEIIDWVAILGALAWMPHVIKYARDLITRPSVRLITQKRPMVGFTSYGAIINLKIAFIVDKKDLVISGMRFKLKHEGGDEKVFAWQSIIQTFGQHTYPEIGSVPFEKESNVLAIKAKEDDVDERFVLFQEESFINGKRDLEEKAVKKLMHLRRQGEKDLENFLVDVEMSDLYTFIKRSFSWREGKYILEFELESPQKFRISGNRYQFTFSSVDIEELENNKDSIQESYRQSVIPRNEDDAQIVWNWRFPELREVT